MQGRLSEVLITILSDPKARLQLRELLTEERDQSQQKFVEVDGKRYSVRT